MTRTLRVLTWATLLGAVAGLPTGTPCYAVDSPRDTVANGKRARLKERLEKGLKARRPEEFAFVAKVVRLVEMGTLPEAVVDGTFFWARSKRRYPFQYFQHALTIRAQRQGIRL